MPSQQQVSSSLSWPIGARSTRLTWEKLGSHEFFEGIAHTLAEICLQLFTSNDNVSYFSSLLELLSLIFQFNQTSLFWNNSTHQGWGFSFINMTSLLNDMDDFLEVMFCQFFQFQLYLPQLFTNENICKFRKIYYTNENVTAVRWVSQ